MNPPDRSRARLAAVLAASLTWLVVNLLLFPLLMFLLFVMVGGSQPGSADSAFSAAILCAAPLSLLAGLALSIWVGRRVYLRKTGASTGPRL